MKKYTVWQENIEKVEVFGVEAESEEEAIRLVKEDDMYADAEEHETLEYGEWQAEEE
ncbi:MULTISPECIES: hypothetical protein [Bacilli]|uniref:hypothetical protein n=1 Tax=Bacilli TaxID=91061 RepID=UPI00142D8CDA|nr:MULTISPECIES: hypothetical protein [Bacilli]MCI2791044.1 hypothetical protein [Staphylococcus pettenkoferi]MCY6991216.1 hypothetical protein [Staphylococcus argensis]MDK7284424.1 hypothetical protein [Staphylococcus pettenkoferi]MDK8168273.1 hypothetical protein [Enterococcus faecalis]